MGFKRGTMNFPEADEFLKGEHPKRFSESEATRLGLGGDAETMEDKTEISKESEFLLFKEGDHLSIRSNYKNHLGILSKRSLPNNFKLVKIETLDDGRVMFSVQNEQNPKIVLRLRAYFFKKYQPDENYSAGA